MVHTDSPAVVLASGGIESSVLLRLERRERPVIAVFVDYGQRAASRERRAAQAQCTTLGLALETLDLRAVGEAFRAGQERQHHVPLPHRNLVLLSLALSYANRVGAGRIALALNRDDGAAYPSAQAGFVQRFNALAGSLDHIRIEAPLIDHSKADIISLGRDLDVDLSTTYSCLLGYERHCGVCPQCHKRRQAVEEAGMTEPEGFYGRT